MKDSFKTIAVFQYSSEALIIKGKLESENIKVFLVDEYTVDTDPLVSNAVGGVKLQVYSEHEERARNVIRAINPDLLKLEVVCSGCNSTDFKLRMSFKNLILKLFPFNGEFEYSCFSCNTNFNAKEVV